MSINLTLSDGREIKCADERPEMIASRTHGENIKTGRRALLLGALCMASMLTQPSRANIVLSALDQSACPTMPAVMEVSAAAIYSDRAGSVIAPSGLHENQELIRPLREFDTAITSRVDGTAGSVGQEDLECAANLLHSWAMAAAMLTKPKSFAAVRERARFSIGINVAAFKLKRQVGHLDTPTLNWLHSLNHAIEDDFASRGIIDNLYVWSGVDAGTYALLDHDPEAIRYVDSVWENGLAKIGDDGLIRTELGRQSRALLYHQYYLSALLFLRQIRDALGKSSTPVEDATLRRLAVRVDEALCDPKAMMVVSGGFEQEMPPPEQFAVGTVFGTGVVDDRWSTCGRHPKSLRDETLGGELEQTAAFLRPESRP
jgi:poly(beta-D-mannuronate) lyase